MRCFCLPKVCWSGRQDNQGIRNIGRSCVQFPCWRCWYYQQCNILKQSGSKLSKPKMVSQSFTKYIFTATERHFSCVRIVCEIWKSFRFGLHFRYTSESSALVIHLSEFWIIVSILVFMSEQETVILSDAETIICHI